MNHQSVFPMQRGAGKRAILALLVATLGLTMIPGVADAAKGKGKGKKKGQDITVMTRNVYLGADLGPGLEAGDLNELADGAGVVVNQVDATNFPLRAVALAGEIKQRKPDLIGLQEVALWREQPFNPLAAIPPTATQVEYDFLDLLLAEVNNTKCKKGGKKKGKSSAKKKKGKPCLRYNAVVVNEEFDFETPVNDVGDPDAGLAGSDRNARLTMRDVILVKQNAGIKTRKPSQGSFPTLLQVSVGGVATLDVTRGWTALEAKVRGSDWFKFVNLHHEAFDSSGSNTTNTGATVGQGEIRQAQAQSLLAPGGAATGKLPVILLGDLNSDDDTVGNDGDVLAYNAYIAGGFRPVDTSNPMSCCLSDPNLVGGSLADFDHHIDHVMTNSKKVKFKKGFVTGLGAVSGLYPSDHAGVTSLLNLPAAGGKKK